MFRSFATKKLKTIGRLQYSNHNKKAFKFLPATIKTSIDKSKLPPPTKVDGGTIQLLEKLSLLGFKTEEGIQVVEDAIRFADEIYQVDTKKVQPLVTVLEDHNLFLREDEVVKDVTTCELLSNCLVSQENYFIAPTGNIPYVPEEKQEEDSQNSSVPNKTKALKN